MEAGHVQLGSHQFFGGDVAKTVDHFAMLVCQIRRNGAVEMATQLDGVIEGITDARPRSEQRARH